VVNFDPDAAGANAAEKSIALLTEEGFTIRIVTLDDGLDPTDTSANGCGGLHQGIARLRRQSDYLIERAQQLFPGAAGAEGEGHELSAAAHPEDAGEAGAGSVCRDAAQKLGIDSAVLREELRQAALRRRDHIETRETALTEVERSYCGRWPLPTRMTRARDGWRPRPSPSNRRGSSI